VLDIGNIFPRNHLTAIVSRTGVTAACRHAPSAGSSELDVSQLEHAHVALLQRLIRNKKFRRYLIAQCYPIAIDGMQKLVRSGQWWAEEWLERRGETADGAVVQQYVYVLEANRVLHNGVTLPLLSEFLSYGEGDPDDHKQDGELKAFYRLAARLKQFMIVRPDKCLPSVWEEVEALTPR
jgi:hypothetical protein